MNTKHRQKNKKIKKILSAILGVLIVFIVGLQLIGIITARSNYGVSNFFGYQTLVVLTDSMEDELPVGSGIIVKRTDPATLEVDDIITFFRPNDGLIVTHRIIEIDEGEERYFRCLGDNIFASTWSIFGMYDC
jgi:signal peptidase I